MDSPANREVARLDASADIVNAFISILQNETGIPLTWVWDRSKTPHVAVVEHGADDLHHERIASAIKRRMIREQLIAYPTLQPQSGIRLIAFNLSTPA